MIITIPDDLHVLAERDGFDDFHRGHYACPTLLQRRATLRWHRGWYRAYLDTFDAAYAACDTEATKLLTRWNARRIDAKAKKDKGFF